MPKTKLIVNYLQIAAHLFYLLTVVFLGVCAPAIIVSIYWSVGFPDDVWGLIPLFLFFIPSSFLLFWHWGVPILVNIYESSKLKRVRMSKRKLYIIGKRSIKILNFSKLIGISLPLSHKINLPITSESISYNSYNIIILVFSDGQVFFLPSYIRDFEKVANFFVDIVCPCPRDLNSDSGSETNVEQ